GAARHRARLSAGLHGRDAALLLHALPAQRAPGRPGILLQPVRRHRPAGLRDLRHRAPRHRRQIRPLPAPQRGAGARQHGRGARLPQDGQALRPMNTALLVVFSYLLGAIPTGYLVVKTLKGIDLRKVGSGSTGATNVLRNAGKPAAAFVLIIDILKGWLPVTLAIQAVRGGSVPELPSMLMPWLPCLCGLLALIGHSKSIFLNFMGGKSAATRCGRLIGCSAAAGFTSRRSVAI